jgi:hypothetical protein
VRKCCFRREIPVKRVHSGLGRHSAAAGS